MYSTCSYSRIGLRDDYLAAAELKVDPSISGGNVIQSRVIELRACVTCNVTHFNPPYSSSTCSVFFYSYRLWPGGCFRVMWLGDRLAGRKKICLRDSVIHVRSCSVLVVRHSMFIQSHPTPLLLSPRLRHLTVLSSAHSPDTATYQCLMCRCWHRCWHRHHSSSSSNSSSDLWAFCCVVTFE